MNLPVVEDRKIAIICAKGGLDEAYPALILANAARAAGIEATIFFNLIDQVEDVITATDFYELTVGAQIVFV